MDQPLDQVRQGAEPVGPSPGDRPNPRGAEPLPHPGEFLASPQLEADERGTRRGGIQLSQRNE